MIVHTSSTPTKAGSFGYAIRQTPAGWTWCAYDPAGSVAASGLASTRALAAAYIIRALAADAVASQPDLPDDLSAQRHAA